MNAPAWAATYIGIPFQPFGRDRSGCDCWGLLRLVLSEQFGIDIPSFSQATWEHGKSAEGNAQQRRLLANLMEANKGTWSPVGAGDELPGDGILLRQFGIPMHVGVIVAKGCMLHTEEGCNAVLADYTGHLWSRRVAGIYRWSGVPDASRTDESNSGKQGT